MTAPAGKNKQAARNRRLMEKLSAERVAAGQCRHCGGPTPCWSPYGDVRPGVRRKS